MTLGAGTARWLLVPILLGYLYLCVGYLRATPRWNNPDEPAHVNVIRYLVQTGSLPVLSEGDWDSDLLARLTTAWFPNDYEINGIRYESHQPPLYYLLAAPVHRLTLDLPLNRQIQAMRLVSIAIGAVGVVASFVVGREAVPSVPVLAVLIASTVAFVPMFTAISAAVNNDSLANTLAAVSLAALMIGRRRGFSDRWAVGLGVLIGAIVLTKLTIYVYVPLILVVLFLAGRDRASAGASWWVALRWPIVASIVGLLVCGWWLVRNSTVYGLTDPLALAHHDAIVVGQPRWTTYDLESLGYFGRILFRSFWGVFGWMGVVLDDGFYFLYLALTLLGIVGLVSWRLSRRRQAPPSGPHPPHHGAPPSASPQPIAMERGRIGACSPLRRGDAGRYEGRGPVLVKEGLGVGLRIEPASELQHRGLLIAATTLVFGEIVYYNLTFIQPQGRYLFPALVPIAVFLSLGWHRLAENARGGPLRRTLLPAPLGATIAWSLGEVHGSLYAVDLWSDNALIAVASIGALVVVLAPATVRRWLPDGLCVLLAVTLGLLDLAALVKFVAPAFPVR